MKDQDIASTASKATLLALRGVKTPFGATGQKAPDIARVLATLANN
jgi:hypothetical protein